MQNDRTPFKGYCQKNWLQNSTDLNEKLKIQSATESNVDCQRRRQENLEEMQIR
jgi:hypothetical protein